MYRCEKCAREFPNYKWRMILSVRHYQFIDGRSIVFIRGVKHFFSCFDSYLLESKVGQSNLFVLSFLGDKLIIF